MQEAITHPEEATGGPEEISGHKVKWIAKGKLYDQSSKGKNPSRKGNISIPECKCDIDMGTNDVFGEPVDAKLAVYFISKLWNEIGDRALKNYKRFNQGLIPGHGAAGELIKSDLNEKESDVELAWTSGQLVNLLSYSAAITVSRSMLLKTLSQPACAGVRFYLALKNKEQETSSRPNDGHDDVVFTLVMVGVDKDGVDLNFGKIQNPIATPVLKNESLSGEYPAPSGLIDSLDLKFEGDSPYVLYQHAMLDMAKNAHLK
jgi:hypothetical protein